MRGRRSTGCIQNKYPHFGDWWEIELNTESQIAMISIDMISTGMISIGMISIGMISIGMISVGTISIGMIYLNWMISI